MDALTLFRELRDACDEIIKALETDDEVGMFTALGRFVVLTMKMKEL